jgi:hypothetical protein
VKVLEVALAALFATGGIRSLWRWSRRPFEGADARDHALFALYLTGRAGLWFSIAGLFLLSASIDAAGQPFVDEFRRYQWYLIVPLALGAVQLLAGYFLGRRGPHEPRRTPADDAGA